MDWIKANYEKVVLAFFALLLLALAGTLAMKANTFNEVFQPVITEPPHNNKVQPVDTAELARAQEELQNPAKWTLPKVNENGIEREIALFVAERTIIVNDQPMFPERSDVPLHPPVPNKWLRDNHLSLLDPNVLNEDPDGDGFTNLEEWTGSDPAHPGAKPTNPNDKNSHPPYTLKLRLRERVAVLFPFVFKSYDGDPKKPATMEFQLSPSAGRGSSQFLKMGDIIPGTNFKITGFKPNVQNINGIEKDISELQIEDTTNNKRMVLPMKMTQESPNPFAVFKFLIGDAPEFRVQTEQTFSLPIEPEKKYKLIDVSKEKNEATLEDQQTKEKIIVPHL